MDSFLDLQLAAMGSILWVPENISLVVAKIYWRHCIEQWAEAWERLTESVNQTYLALASDKLVLQNREEKKVQHQV